jgi:hypothetical protein
MGKRSDFKRMKNDLYPTPYKAVLPLLPHVATGTKYIEPCVGNGDLVYHLEKYGIDCVFKSDITPAPRGRMHQLLDATTAYYEPNPGMFITNPPWTREILHPLILNLSSQASTWLLFDADWAHTVQAVPYLHFCRKIVAVGRLKWIPDSKFTGKDNCCWYLFDSHHSYVPPQFFGRSVDE